MLYGRDRPGAAAAELASKIDAYIERRNARLCFVKRSLGGTGPLQFRASLGLAA